VSYIVLFWAGALLGPHKYLSTSQRPACIASLAYSMHSRCRFVLCRNSDGGATCNYTDIAATEVIPALSMTSSRDNDVEKRERTSGSCDLLQQQKAAHCCLLGDVTATGQSIDIACDNRWRPLYDVFRFIVYLGFFRVAFSLWSIVSERGAERRRWCHLANRI